MYLGKDLIASQGLNGTVQDFRLYYNQTLDLSTITTILCNGTNQFFN